VSEQGEVQFEDVPDPAVIPLGFAARLVARNFANCLNKGVKSGGPEAPAFPR